MLNFKLKKVIQITKFSIELFIACCLVKKFSFSIHLLKNEVKIPDKTDNENDKSYFSKIKNYFLNRSLVLVHKFSIEDEIENNEKTVVLIRNPYNSQLVMRNIIGFPGNWVKSEDNNIYYKVSPGNIWLEAFSKEYESVKDSSNIWGAVSQS